jgi:hypothetical protein
VAVEALALGLPLVSLTLSGRPPLLDFTVPGQAACIGDRSQLATVTSRLLAEARVGGNHAPEREVLLQDLIGPLDGASACRVATIVEECLDKGMA